MKPVIAVVIPCYNEQEAIIISTNKILDIIHNLVSKHEISDNSFILCVDDGSKDKTWEIIEHLHKKDKRIKGISLAHNRGHQFALLAGLMTVKDISDAAISIDADLQDDPEAIAQMVKFYNDGYDIVYGVRSDRESDTFFKKHSAHAFYKLQKLMGLESIFDHADYRLMDKRSLNLLSEYNERNLFLRGIIPSIGLKHTKVYYKRANRVAGESKYPLSKMISLSIDGITSFSIKPIKLVLYIGIIMLICTFIMTIYVFASYLSKNIIAGWTSLMLSLWFIGSLTLIAVGTIGLYIGKIYIEVKQRPRYSINQYLID